MAMDQVLLGLLGLLFTHCYLDDILKQEKCLFFQESVEYLGRIIDAVGLHKSPDKEHAIVGAPAPTNVSQPRSFLAMINYYGRFIPNLATILNPLNALLHKGKK